MGGLILEKINWIWNRKSLNGTKWKWCLSKDGVQVWDGNVVVIARCEKINHYLTKNEKPS